MDLENQILHGDCLDLLKNIPDETFDSFVSDVPYGLGKREPRPEEILAYLNGSSLSLGDFMGKEWEIPSIPIWKEVYRVLKPGAYVVCFGGPRTFDLISLGIRMAGFECRDCIADFSVELPVLQWVYASGMPKSHNVGKSVAKKTQEVDWSGWGSALKPAWEPILLFRKPFKGTIADNVLHYGTGALNIDATRVRHSSKEDFEEHKKQVDAIRAKGGVRGNSWKNSSDLSGAEEVKESGRWPANLLLQHAPECQKTGVLEALPHPQGPDRFQKTSGGSFSKSYGNQEAQTSPEYLSTYSCVPGCPVAEMNSQSGDRPSTLTGRADPNSSHTHPGTELNPNSTFLGERTHLSRVYADAGGASRFFTQFDGVPFRYIPKANRLEAGSYEFEIKHPTLKPLSLMRWLVKLVTPPNGFVLDPYCGSGTTCHAALVEGFRFLGIERDKESFEEAQKRLAPVLHEYLLAALARGDEV